MVRRSSLANSTNTQFYRRFAFSGAPLFAPSAKGGIGRRSWNVVLLYCQLDAFTRACLFAGQFM